MWSNPYNKPEEFHPTDEQERQWQAEAEARVDQLFSDRREQRLSKLKMEVEALAEWQGCKPIEVITRMQTACTMNKNQVTLNLLDELCSLKWDYIDLGIGENDGTES